MGMSPATQMVCPMSMNDGIYVSPLSTGKNCCCATEESIMSIGFVSSYKDGASHKMANVPTMEAMVKIQRKRRSRTMATKPQSWSS